MKTNGIFRQHPEQFSFVNQFGPRFLKNRIQMMNQASQSGRSWLVYLVLFTVTGLVTTMAAVEKPKKPSLAVVKKKPTVKAKPTLVFSAVVDQADSPTESDLKIVPKPVEELVEKSVAIPDSAQVFDEIPVVNTEKQSRYVVREGKLLYWVITPKMSFKDLSELKQTIEEQSQFTFDFTHLKFDPFQVYINAIGVKVHKPNGSSGSTSNGDETGEPIKSIGGYLAESGSLGMGMASSGMPDVLSQVVKEDEASIAGLVTESRMAYLIQKNQKFMAGSRSTVKGEWLRANPGRRNENLGVFINASGQLQLYHPESVAVFIDGQAVSADQIAMFDPKQLHTVIINDVRDESAGPGRKKRYVQLFLSQ
ncbi:hypothetical protein [Larkinella sp.]|uniref:hypothetical protein n=1 Tax=Larkinella sp. TaxID=2034517 RepID=UPI003BAAE084